MPRVEPMGSPIPDPEPHADRAERLRARLRGSFGDYHARSSEQDRLLEELIEAVREAERERVLRAVRGSGAALVRLVTRRLERGPG